MFGTALRMHLDLGYHFEVLIYLLHHSCAASKVMIECELLAVMLLGGRRTCL